MGDLPLIPLYQREDVVRRLLFGCLLVVVFLASRLVAALPTQAQEELTETYVSSDGNFTFDYPTGWTVQEILMPGFVLVSANESFASSPESGDLEMVIVGPQATDLYFMGTSPANLHEALTFLMGPDALTGEIARFGEPQALTCNGYDALMVSASDSLTEGIKLVMEINGEYATITADAVPGEYDEFADTVLAIANTLDYVVPAGLLTFEGYGFSFDYPAGWTPFNLAIEVYLSNTMAFFEDLTPGQVLMNLMLTDLAFGGGEDEEINLGDVSIQGTVIGDQKTVIKVVVEGDILAEFTGDTIDTWLQTQKELGQGQAITVGIYDGVLIEFTGVKNEGIIVVLTTDRGPLLAVAVTLTGEFAKFEGDVMAIVESIAITPSR
jgi:hypothetical protein